ncbi:MAG TPA: hypothetical protein VGP41_03410 [Candidatus Lustribacter sp.]|jgi:hypothetical protein|nr:hypothetical protein [Candidatus Lustribacter sp.]
MRRRHALGLIVAAAIPAVAGAAVTESAPPRVIFGGPPPELTAPDRPNEAPPAISAIWFSQTAYAWGDLARIALVTTTNVALVEMRLIGYGRALTKKSLGHFDGLYRVPFMPPVLDRFHYALPFRFIVRNPGGDAASFDVTVPVV